MVCLQRVDRHRQMLLGLSSARDDVVHGFQLPGSEKGLAALGDGVLVKLCMILGTCVSPFAASSRIQAGESYTKNLCETIAWEYPGKVPRTTILLASQSRIR